MSTSPDPHLVATPLGVLRLDAREDGREPPDVAAARRVLRAFGEGLGAGLLSLAGRELESDLDPTLDFGRRVTRSYLHALCSREDDATDAPLAPDHDALEALLPTLPPMLGAEYVSTATLENAWNEIDDEVRARRTTFDGDRQEFVHGLHPHWNSVGRVTFHLAERKQEPERPFAFLATYTDGLTTAGRPRHVPLARALERYRGDRSTLLKLLRPVEAAAKSSPLAHELSDSGDLYRPLAWTPEQAWCLLQAVPDLQEAGVVVRLPSGSRTRAARPVVSATVGESAPSHVGLDALLSFDATVTLDGVRLTKKEQREILRGEAGLRLLKGRWVEVDPDQLRRTLEQFEAAVAAAEEGGLTFHEAMRLLAGARIGGARGPVDMLGGEESWAEVRSGPWLKQLLEELGRTDDEDIEAIGDLSGTLRPYQRAGVRWLMRIARYGLGGCLADDMGLGKTLQVIALIVALPGRRFPKPHLLVVPTSLLANWRHEVERFAPALRLVVAHRSEQSVDEMKRLSRSKLARVDVLMTTYGTLPRLEWIAKRRWGLVVLDEAQAIKNPNTRQARATKSLEARARVALTGTPVENRLGDLWSLYDFLCPGLLGTSHAFKAFTRELQQDEAHGFAPLRRVIDPYLLRRLKTDRRVITDLPDKTEVDVYCGLTKKQATLYQESVEELARILEEVDPKSRRGVVLAFLMRFKQICNHPSQWSGDGGYDPEESGKFVRLRELCEPLRERQERVLVFTQFRETVQPITRLLEGVFGSSGVPMHGGTTVKQRQQRVARFQSESGPPFFVLSLKVGGTGLNLTAANHVIHFDRWWNPAVENQATDRAFRIGQKRNVLVHKFICRGTVEESIDRILADKRNLAEEVVAAGGGEALLTEMPSEELIELVSLDLQHAMTGSG